MHVPQTYVYRDMCYDCTQHKAQPSTTIRTTVISQYNCNLPFVIKPPPAEIPPLHPTVLYPTPTHLEQKAQHTHQRPLNMGTRGTMGFSNARPPSGPPRTTRNNTAGDRDQTCYGRRVCSCNDYATRYTPRYIIQRFTIYTRALHHDTLHCITLHYTLHYHRQYKNITLHRVTVIIIITNVTLSSS